MKILILIFFAGCFFKSNAQHAEPLQPVSEQSLENITAANNGEPTEDDSYQQQMEQYRKDPIDINTADENDWKSLQLLSVFQVRNLLSYRRQFGKFISVY